MYPILFSIGSVNFYTHGLLMAIGALTGSWMIFNLARKENLPTKFLFDLIVLSLFAGLIGGRIAYIIIYYYEFPNWHEMFLVWYGGLVSYGGIIFGYLAASLVLHKRGQNILKWFDIGTIGLLLGWSFGRIGCLLSGDVLGLVSTSKIAIWGSIPVTLFESIWTLILAGFLYYLYCFKKNILQKFGDGFIFFLGIILYAFGRFMIDFYRDDSVLFIFKTGQIASLAVIILILAIIYFNFKRRKNA